MSLRFRRPTPAPCRPRAAAPLLAACALLAGCAGGTPWGATPQNWPQVPLPRLEQIPAHVEAGTTAGSLRLAERVQAALATQPALAGVQVEGLEGGLVVLSGALSSAAERAQAVQTARQVVGVREVVDRMSAP